MYKEVSLEKIREICKKADKRYKKKNKHFVAVIDGKRVKSEPGND